MRRIMSDAETRAVFCSGKLGRLGCVVEGQPYVVPISYVCDEEDGCIYSHSLLGLKIAALRAFPRACLQVDEIVDELRWRSVIAFGSFEEIDDNLERERILCKLLKHLPLLTPVESYISGDAVPPRTIVFRLRIDRVTGVAEESDERTYARAIKAHEMCMLMCK